MAKILIIDDDGIVQDALSVFLTRAGYEVLAVANGADGLAAFRRTAPDLVILDRELPGLSGSEVLAGIREAGRGTKVLILTGYDDPEDAAKYLKAGADSFLSKGDGLSNVLTETDRLLGAAKTTAPAPAGDSVSAPKKGKILVADDDDSFRSMITRYLGSLGYDVFSAIDGDSTISAAKKYEPDLLLLDIAMPGKDGVEVLKDLAASRPAIGILMITGNEDEEIARTCLKNGAFDYLAKPFNLESMATIVKTRLLVQKKSGH